MPDERLRKNVMRARNVKNRKGEGEKGRWTKAVVPDAGCSTFRINHFKNAIQRTFYALKESEGRSRKVKKNRGEEERLKKGERQEVRPESTARNPKIAGFYIKT